MTEPAPSAATAAAAGFTHRQILVIMSGLMAGMLLAALDQTIVATAIRTIADDLHGLNHQAWATTASLITATIVTPLYGKLGDIYGRKRLFIIAISIFIFGSILCTFSTSMFSLSAFPTKLQPAECSTRTARNRLRLQFLRKSCAEAFLPVSRFIPRHWPA